jgi:hypothetical protein
MPASSTEVYRLMERMHEALADVAAGQPRHVVAEAVTRVAAAFVQGAAGAQHEADALVIAATIMAEIAAERRGTRTTH